MRSFFRTVLAVLVGMFLFFGLALLFFMVVVGIALSALSTSHIGIEEGAASIEMGQKAYIRDGSLLHLKLKGEISERGSYASDDFWEALKEHFDDKDIKISKLPPGLLGIAYAIRTAATDPKIKGISMEWEDLRIGYAQLKELHEALKAFKSSGKFIYGYTEHLTERGYYLASVADTVMMYPYADAEFDGFLARFFFFKGTLDLIGLNPRAFSEGKYKSAVEAFTRSSLSADARKQYKVLVDDMYRHYLQDIAQASGHNESQLRKAAAALSILDAEDALAQNFITHLGYPVEYDDLLRERLQLKKNQKIPLVSVSRYKRYLHTSSQKRRKSNNMISVIVAEGEIQDEDLKRYEDISPGNFLPMLERAAKNTRVKAIVIRINSPGGSFTGSDKIWRAIRSVAQKKPVIASISNVAASGGYYIAMACDKIVAYPNTITGSIGVFSLFLESQKLQKMIGLSEDRIKSAPQAEVSAYGPALSATQVRVIQEKVSEVYQVFLDKAAQGRSLSPEEIHEVAQGRVWTGAHALKQNLIDDIGDFQSAMHLAAAAAQIQEDYQVEYMCAKDHVDFMRAFLENMQISFSGLQFVFPKKILKMHKEMKYIADKNPLSIQNIQTRMPYQLDIH